MNRRAPALLFASKAALFPGVTSPDLEGSRAKFVRVALPSERHLL